MLLDIAKLIVFRCMSDAYDIIHLELEIQSKIIYQELFGNWNSNAHFKANVSLLKNDPNV